MGIFLIILILIFLLWPTIMKWMRRYMANKAEDFLRNAAGMPPRQDSRRGAKGSRQNSGDFASSANARQSGRRRRTYTPSGPIIPKEYAQDVEFVETKEFSQTTIDPESGSSFTEWHESQVSDAEWEDIKPQKK